MCGRLPWRRGATLPLFFLCGVPMRAVRGAAPERRGAQRPERGAESPKTRPTRSQQSPARDNDREKDGPHHRAKSAAPTIARQVRHTWAAMREEHTPELRLRRLRFLLYAVKLVAEFALAFVLQIGVGARIGAYTVRQTRLTPAAARRLRCGVPYGAGGRQQRLDIHLPAPSPKIGAEGTPAVVFVPGGAWGSCGRWMYTLLARNLARWAKMPVLVVGYRYFPHGCVDDMVSDVDEAVRWLFSHADELGVDPARVCLFGHSAGAHLTFLALLRIAAERRSDGAQPPLPAVFVGSAGVYDIEGHYRYEAWRGVSELSTMKPAMMCARHGRDEAAEQCLRDWNALHQLRRAGNFTGEREPSQKRRRRAMPVRALHGDEPTARAGLRREEHRDLDTDGASVDTRCYLLTSGQDGVVPWYSSAEFHNGLLDANISSRLLVYPGVEHADFVMDWMRGTDRDNRQRLFVPEAMSHLHNRSSSHALHVDDLLCILESLHVGAETDDR